MPFRSYTKVTLAMVKSVKRLHSSGMPIHTIAKHYNISRQTVKRILNGERDHVKDGPRSEAHEKHPYPDVPRSGFVDPINTRRCGKCGGRVQKNRACYLCYLRDLKERTKATNGDRHDATTISHSGNGRDMQANVGQRQIETPDR